MKTLIPISSEKHSSALAFERELEIDVLARTLWGEARGEGSAGMQAVANVVMNRVNIGGWWGNSIIEVCQKPYQFSCWNKDDPNYRQLTHVDSNDLHFATAQRMARRAIYGALPDITEGADHYHAAGITPIWSSGERPVAVIGNHIFYRLTKD